jgi:hypothetical protein
MAAIKAVKDSLNTDSRGSITALRGLWKVFDEAVSELGAELHDSLSNKAIFEGEICVVTMCATDQVYETNTLSLFIVYNQSQCHPRET